MITGDEPAMPKMAGTAHDGLTIRQYFAAMAMQGILANAEFMANHQNIDIHWLAVRNADDLINELNKTEPK